MRQAHRQWSARIRDVGFLPEFEIAERSRGRTPYELGQDADRYNFEAIFAAAELATSLDDAKVHDVAELLSHRDSGVRYWGTIGLLARGQAGFDAAREPLLRALDDPSPIVRITAAESVGRHGSDPDTIRALDVLIESASPAQAPTLNLAAWNALDYLDARVRPVVDRMRAISAVPKLTPQRWGDYARLLKRKALADMMPPNPNLN
jgi:uncharacterized sulfatase